MSDGSLSQDEIDALLQGTDTIEMDTGAGSAPSPLSPSSGRAPRPSAGSWMNISRRKTSPPTSSILL